MRTLRTLVLGVLLGLGLALPGWAGEYKLANGNTLRGEIASTDEDGMVVALDVGGFSRREPWVSFSQDTLRELGRDPKYAALVEPFIELSPEELSQRQVRKEIVIRNVEERLERPAPRPSLATGFLTPVGLLMLGLLFAGNMFAAYEIALFRSRPPAIVCGLSVILPVLAPVLFLALPGQAAAEPSAIAPEEAAPAQGSAPAVADRGGTNLALATAEKPAAAAAHTQPQVFQRGENTFNRRFFESKFPGFFRVVLGEAEKDLVLVIRTPKQEYVGKRISRISSNELHLQLLGTGGEASISFTEITTVILKHKDAKA